MHRLVYGLKSEEFFGVYLAVTLGLLLIPIMAAV